MKICEDVWKIAGEGNVYVILGDIPVVIDTGDSRDRKRIAKEISEIVPLGDVKVVLLTHLHYDHAGNIGLFPNAEVYADSAEIEDLREGFGDFFSNISSDKLKVLPGARAGIPSDEGNICGLKVIRVPGHTKGSVAFLYEDRKLLFSGDSVFENGIGRTDFGNSVEVEMEKSVGKLVGFLREGIG